MDGGQILGGTQCQDGSQSQVAERRWALKDQCGQDVSLGPFRDLGSNGDQEWARFESPHQGTDLSKMSSAIGCLHYFYDYINRVIISF